mgnify:CR=1 FL=1
MSKNRSQSKSTSHAAGARAAIDAHLARLRACLGAVDTARVNAIAERLRDVAAAGGLIFTAGNGGSAATASHMALDFGKSTFGRPPRVEALRVRALSLADPSPVLTAWANDEGYEGVFAEQVTALARRGDAIVLLSVSGNSPNVVAAARAARSAGAAVIALTGHPGGGVRGLADLAVVVPSDDYRVVEDVHLAISHMLTGYLAEALAPGSRAPAPAAPRRSSAVRRRQAHPARRRRRS